MTHMAIRSWVTGAVVALLASGCATEVDVSSLRREQRDLARRLADTRADVEGLRVQVARLRGQLEDRRGRSSPTAATEIEERLRALEASVPLPGEQQPDDIWPPPASEFGTTAPPPREPPPPPRAAEGTTVAVESDFGRSESDEYRAGLQQHQRGDQQKAVQTLRTFVNKNPKNEAVPYAQYWIGEAYFAQGKYNEAILAYNEILVGWPKSERVPAALLRQAAAFAELGDKIDARLILQKLIAEYPGSEEAARAKRQLLALGN